MTELLQFRKPGIPPHKRRYREPDEPTHAENGKRLRTRHDEAFKERLSGEQNHRCCYCGVRTNEWPAIGQYRFASQEHVVRFADGGSDDYDNLVMACYQCNIDKDREEIRARKTVAEVRRLEAKRQETYANWEVRQEHKKIRNREKKARKKANRRLGQNTSP